MGVVQHPTSITMIELTDWVNIYLHWVISGISRASLMFALLFVYCLLNCLQLCAHAQNWADRLAREDNMYHRPNNSYGENIYMMWSSNNAQVRYDSSVY